MTSGAVGHDVSGKARTGDIAIDENIRFEGLLLSEHILEGLRKSGFHRPSPIQLKAIPLGKCGLDLVVQAKSGTGKTCVFGVIALESLITDLQSVQVIVLAPTREVAVQIVGVLRAVGADLPGLSCHPVIGGLPLSDDKQNLKNCQIAVGTPGRVVQLIEQGILGVDSVRLFILDEADKLLDETFKDNVNYIYWKLPENKQMVAVSATYPEAVATQLTQYMRNPTCVRMNAADPALLGIRQYYAEVPYHPLQQQALQLKLQALQGLLARVEFEQCLIFSNYQLRAQWVSDELMAAGWPCSFISGHQEQQQRLEAMDSLRSFTCRLLVCTDVAARGIDVQNVNLVVNLDVPWDHETYLHRIGRAGRYGSYGAAISFVCKGKEVGNLKRIEAQCQTNIIQLPDPVPADLCKPSDCVPATGLVTVEKFTSGETSTATDNVNGCPENTHEDTEPSVEQTATERREDGRTSDVGVGVAKRKDPVLHPGSPRPYDNIIQFGADELTALNPMRHVPEKLGVTRSLDRYKQKGGKYKSKQQKEKNLKQDVGNDEDTQKDENEASLPAENHHPVVRREGETTDKIRAEAAAQDTTPGAGLPDDCTAELSCDLVGVGDGAYNTDTEQTCRESGTTIRQRPFAVSDFLKHINGKNAPSMNGMDAGSNGSRDAQTVNGDPQATETPSGQPSTMAEFAATLNLDDIVVEDVTDDLAHLHEQQEVLYRRLMNRDDDSRTESARTDASPAHQSPGHHLAAGQVRSNHSEALRTKERTNAHAGPNKRQTISKTTVRGRAEHAACASEDDPSSGGTSEASLCGSVRRDYSGVSATSTRSSESSDDSVDSSASSEYTPSEYSSSTRSRSRRARHAGGDVTDRYRSWLTAQYAEYSARWWQQLYLSERQRNSQLMGVLVSCQQQLRAHARQSEQLARLCERLERRDRKRRSRDDRR